MKLIFRHAHLIKDYIKDAISYHAVKYKVNAGVTYDTNFEEEKILGMYLSNSDLYLAQLTLESLRNSDVREKIIASEVWWAEIVGDTVEMQFGIMTSGDPTDEDYVPMLYLPRCEVAYAVERWIAFLKRETDPEYSEIIDTEDIYR